MKKLKCILAIILGFILGLISSCARKEKSPAQEKQPQQQQEAAPEPQEVEPA